MRFVTCRLPDGVEDPAILSQDGTQVWPLSWLGLSYETLSDAIPFLTPQVRFGLQLAISGIPALPVEAVTLQSPIPCPAQDVVCLGINYMAHSDEAEKYSADAFSTQHQDAIYFSKRVSRAVPDGGFIEAHTDLVQKLDYECELAVVLGKDAKDVPAGQHHQIYIGIIDLLCQRIGGDMHLMAAQNLPAAGSTGHQHLHLGAAEQVHHQQSFALLGALCKKYNSFCHKKNLLFKYQKEKPRAAALGGTRLLSQSAAFFSASSSARSTLSSALSTRLTRLMMALDAPVLSMISV